jgi:hypothetical protein
MAPKPEMGQDESDPREPYEAPAIDQEQEFERVLLACCLNGITVKGVQAAQAS